MVITYVLVWAHLLKRVQNGQKWKTGTYTCDGDSGFVKDVETIFFNPYFSSVSIRINYKDFASILKATNEKGVYISYDSLFAITDIFYSEDLLLIFKIDDFIKKLTIIKLTSCI